MRFKRRYKSNSNSIFILAQNGNFEEIMELFPIRSTDKKNNEGLWAVDTHKRNILDIAAEHDKLDKVPKELFIRSLILNKTTQGENLLHLAASYGGLKFIPKEFLSTESLSILDNRGNTVYHYAANCGYIEEIPDEAINESSLLLLSSYKTTVIEEAMFRILSDREKNLRLINKLLDKLSIKSLIHIEKRGHEKSPAIKKYLKGAIQEKVKKQLNTQNNKVLVL